MTIMSLGLRALAGGVLAAAMASAAAAWTIDAVRTDPPFDLNQDKLVPLRYTSLEPQQATKKWSLCVLLPHTDNPFMLSVLYGAVTEAKRMGVSLEAKSAGGYSNV